jgi:hypothetical protein
MRTINLLGLRPAICLCLIVVGSFASHDAGAQTLNLQNWNVWTSNPHGSTAVYVLTHHGDIITTLSSGRNTADVSDWIIPKTNMSDYQVRATANTCTGPATGVWLPLSVSYSWHVMVSVPAWSASCSVSLEISAIANPSVILDSASITLQAIRTS